MDAIQKDLLKRINIIRWRVDNETETRNAEKQKNILENKGYMLIGEDIGIFTGKLIYKI